MVTLHGFSFSNYYNAVKHVLMYKGIAFQEDLRYGDDEHWLELSPVGKIPALTTEQGQHLSESSVCCDYLEETYPEKPLYPADVYARNRIRQIMKVAELYLELPCRRFIPFVFMKTEAPEELKAEVRETVARGLGALRRLGRFSPWVAGDAMTMADIYLFHVLTVAQMAAESQMDWKLIDEIDGLSQWYETMAGSEIAQRIDADRQANGPEFFTQLQRRFGI